MRIGTVEIPGKLVLAPMAGVTDLAFRTICRELGASLTVTEMVSAKALCYQDKKTLPLLEIGEGEHPCAVQLFGSDPVSVEEGAAIALEKSGADILDFNMGCPVPKIVACGDGSALNLEGKNRNAAVREVFFVKCVVRMIFKRGVIDFIDFRIVREEIDDL